jgi:hypothetical protein
MSTAVLPELAWLSIAKPNIGIALAIAYAPSWCRGRNLVVNACAVALLLAVSWLLRPHWFTEWLAVVRGPTPHIVVPVMMLGGPIVLLALFRWRRPEARLLAGLVCVPQTFSSYDSLIVFLAADTRRDALLLVAGTTLVTLVISLLGTPESYAEAVHRFAPFRIALVYAPAVWIILRRPNCSASSVN